ncbi:MAG: hypothetical protein GTO40_19015, partial [Deltaproteobacteria bacterium]|nr:hypothetical protein [Deltaproteobacteria bacterium]
MKYSERQIVSAIAVIGLAVFLFCIECEGASAAAGQPNPGIEETITITSDRMELDQKRNSIIYIGNVVTV